MKLFTVLGQRRYAALALLVAVGMGLLYPYLQVALNGGLANYWFWFTLIAASPVNLLLYLAFSALFGVVIALIAFDWRSRTCRAGGVGAGGIGSVLAVSATQCSSCLSLVTLFFPAAAGALAQFSTAFLSVSIGLLAVSIHVSGGFRPLRGGSHA